MNQFVIALAAGLERVFITLNLITVSTYENFSSRSKLQARSLSLGMP